MSSEAMEQELRVLEERLGMPAVTETRESLSRLLAIECREFGSLRRIYDVASILDALIPGARPAIQFEDFAVVPVGTSSALVTYRSRSVAGPGWKPPALRSSLWIWREARWQVLFHQGTRVLADSEA
jgi:hypothetical protein